MEGAKKYWIIVTGITLAALTATSLQTKEYRVIRDPKPLTKVKNHIPLVPVKTIGDELGGGQYLFFPASAVVDAKGQLLVMDTLQSKIFVFGADHAFIRSFGRPGEGPGEFLKKTRNSPVEMTICLDGNLWVHEVNNLRISVFNPEGRFLRFIRLQKSLTSGLQADAAGNLLSQQFRVNRVDFTNSANELVFSLPHAKEEKEILFAKPRPDPRFAELDKIAPFFYEFYELQCLWLDNRTLAIMFLESGEFIRVQDKKAVYRGRVWPEELIFHHRKRVLEDESHKMMFFVFMTSFCGQRERIFLYTSISDPSNTHLIYELDRNGRIVADYRIRDKRPNMASLFLAAGRDVFYFRNEDGLEICKPQRR